MENSPFKIYSSKEIEALFRAALEADQKLIPYLALSAFAGLRKIEIENLRLTDVDFEAGEPRICVREFTSAEAKALLYVLP